MHARLLVIWWCCAVGWIASAPMDLSTISHKIMNGGGYGSMAELKQAVDLIISNCR